MSIELKKNINFFDGEKKEGRRTKHGATFFYRPPGAERTVRHLPLSCIWSGCVRASTASRRRTRSWRAPSTAWPPSRGATRRKSLPRRTSTRFSSAWQTTRRDGFRAFSGSRLFQIRTRARIIIIKRGLLDGRQGRSYRGEQISYTLTLIVSGVKTTDRPFFRSLNMISSTAFLTCRLSGSNSRISVMLAIDLRNSSKLNVCASCGTTGTITTPSHIHSSFCSHTPNS